MTALQLKWDTPYRLLASVMSIGCFCVLFGLIDATSPINALGQIGAYLGLDEAPNFASAVSTWLVTRKEIVCPIAFVLTMFGVIFNLGDGSGRGTLVPGPWRGAPTAVLTFAVLWEVSPGNILGWVIQLGFLLVGALIYSWIVRNHRMVVLDWLRDTGVNLLASMAYILVPLLWAFSRSRP